MATQVPNAELEVGMIVTLERPDSKVLWVVIETGLTEDEIAYADGVVEHKPYFKVARLLDPLCASGEQLARYVYDTGQRCRVRQSYQFSEVL